MEGENFRKAQNALKATKKRKEGVYRDLEGNKGGEGRKARRSQGEGKKRIARELFDVHWIVLIRIPFPPWKSPRPPHFSLPCSLHPSLPPSLPPSFP